MKEVLGTEVKDRVTGFQGIATGYVSYLTGCDQILITPKVDKEGKLIEANWYDINRVDSVEDGRKVNVDTSKEQGPDKPAPVK